jgi:hypothetical protein
MVQPTNDPTLVGDQSGNSFNRYVLSGGAGINWRPGGGILTWRLGGLVRHTGFVDSVFDDLDNTKASVVTSGRWKFLPRTALLYRGELGFQSYSTNTPGRVDSTPIDSQLGISGLVTNHFGLLVMGGWHATFYDGSADGTVQDYDGPVGRAELAWYPMPAPTLQQGSAVVGLSSVAVGYLRDVQNSYLGNFVQRDRLYTTFDYFAGGQILLKLTGGFTMNHHPQSFFNDGAARKEAFQENRADASAFLEYRFADTLVVNLDLGYTAALSDEEIPADSANPEVLDVIKFNRFQAMLGLRWFM